MTLHMWTESTWQAAVLHDTEINTSTAKILMLGQQQHKRPHEHGLLFRWAHLGRQARGARWPAHRLAQHLTPEDGGTFSRAGPPHCRGSPGELRGVSAWQMWIPPGSAGCRLPVRWQPGCAGGLCRASGSWLCHSPRGRRHASFCTILILLKRALERRLM